MESTFMDDAVVYFQDIAIISSADVFFFFFNRLNVYHDIIFGLLCGFIIKHDLIMTQRD